MRETSFTTRIKANRVGRAPLACGGEQYPHRTVYRLTRAATCIRCERFLSAGAEVTLTWGEDGQYRSFICYDCRPWKGEPT